MWFDYNRDGKLDLLIGHYVKWNRESDLKQHFTLTGIGRTYGQPTAFGGTFLSLYKNEGDRLKTSVKRQEFKSVIQIRECLLPKA